MNDDAIVQVMANLGLNYDPAVKASEQFQKTIGDTNKQLDEMKTKAMQSAKDINNAFTSQLCQINNKQIVDQWSRPIQSMQKEVHQTATAMAEMKIAHESVAVAAEKHRTPIKELAGQYNLLGTKVDNSTQSFTANAAQLYAISKAAKEAIGTIKDVEIGMVEIQRVMDDGSFVFSEYRDNLLGLGVDYGQTFDTVQNIALRWAQSGYNVADSLKLAETSLLALNAGELDAKYATEAMIGIMAQWQLQADDLSLVMDKINKTADSYSTTAQDLVDGLLRSSGAAKVMNLSLEDTISLLTVMREASGRTGKEVGNALNSILSYIQRPKSIDVMEAMGIKVFADEAKTQFRNALEIFQDIAVNWDKTSKDIQDGFVAAADDAELFNEDLAVALGLQEEWNDLQKRDISQAAAGVHRRNFFIGMIERMADVQGVLNTMMDAEGYIVEKNALAMDTLEKKQMSLKASVEALAVAMGDAGLGGVLKSLTIGATKTVNAINEMPKGARDTIMIFTELTLTVKALEAGMGLFNLNLPIASAGINLLTGGIANLTTNTMALGTAIKTSLVSNAPLLIISATIGGIVALTNHMKRAREEAKAFITTTQENIQSLDEQKQGLTELASEYETLKNKEKNLTATAEEKERLKEVQRELVELYDVSISGIDAEGNAYADSVEDIRARIEALEELEDIEKRRLETALKGKREDDIKFIQESTKELERLEQNLIEVDQRIKKMEDSYRNRENVFLPDGRQIIAASKDYDARVQSHIEKQRQYADEIQTDIEDLKFAIDDETREVKDGLINHGNSILTQLDKTGNELSDGARLAMNKFSKGLATSSEGSLDTLKTELENFIDELVELDKQYQQAISDGGTTAIDEAHKAIMDFVAIIATGRPELDNFVISMEKLYPTAENLAKGMDDVTSSTIDLSGAMRRMGSSAKKEMDNLKVLNQAIYDVQKGKSLSIDTILDLIEKYDLSTDAIKKTTDGYTIEASTLENLRKAKVQMSIDGINAEIKLAETTRDNIRARLTNYGLEIEMLGDLAKARAALAGTATGSNAQVRARVSEQRVNEIGLEAAMEEAKRDFMREANYDLLQYEKYVNELDELNKRADLLKGMLQDGSYGVTKSSKSKTGKKTEKYENKELDHALKMLEHRKRITEETQKSIQAEINELKRINKLYVKTADERMDMTERIYAAEKRLKDRRLQDSVNWINEKKNLDQLSVEEEIAAWERVRKNQANNIEARKQAELNLYKLRNQVMIDSYNKEENHIKHITKFSIYSTEQQIEKYRELYKYKAQTLAEEQARVENLFSLYKQLISDQQRTVKVAYDERIKQIDEEARRKKEMHDEEIKAIEKELELLDRQEDEYDHDKRMADLREQLAYWQVRTSEDARKKVAELLKQIDEEEHKREVELKRQGLEDKKKVLQDEIRSVDDTAKEEKEKWEKSYKEIEIAFDDHSINMIAYASTMSKGMFEEFQNNYLIPLEEALRSGDYGLARDIASGIDDYAKGAFDKTYNTTNAQVYRLASQILEYKRQYEYGGDKNSHQRALPLYDELEKLKPNVADMLHHSNYMTAKEFVEGLPRAHTGAKTLSYGAVYMKPGELVFPPDLSMKLEDLIQVLYARPIQQSQTSSYMTDRSIVQNFNAPLYNSERTIFEDDIDGEILARELKRTIDSTF